MLSTKRVVRFIFAVLLVSVAASCCYAVDVTPFFKIYEDYRQNPFKAEKKWKNEVITIEGTVNMMGKDQGGNPVVAFGMPKPDGRKGNVAYGIYFDSNNSPERLFDLIEGQTAKFIGQVFDIKENDDTLFIYMAGLEILD